ncbi:putative fmn-binding split barrel-related protein [Neofusicoccum parvum UCRNP2]|uniref:Putative fmn-binding split barrel-related protein n=1 Tax=Botryosphaeria parva (strain UCR-NP2) TaxID=1287680 RepID=R1ETQ6_BOTPV|nr:putative fmn-binding split barrel-related protein [Neofusicoccum parvum UCRNP2]
MGEAYTQTPYAKFNRHKERGTYDAETVHNIVNTTSVLHVSFTTPDSPFPVVLPMIGQIGQYEGDSEPHCYLHGYVSTRMMNVCSAQEAGLPLTISATKVDGLVLALSPFSHSYNYRSAILFGHATVLPPFADGPSKDPHPESLWAMELITDSVIPGRWKHTRVPPAPAEIQSTRILKVAVASATAKARTGPPKDERRDLRDQAVVGAVWAGVVPVWERFGDPVPAGYGAGAALGVPEHVAAFVRAENANAEEYAVGVAGEEVEVGGEGE